MGATRTGLERFVEPASDRAGLAPDARVGVVAHPASVDREGRTILELLLERTRLRVTRLFAPEHGLEGEAQDMEVVTGAAEGPRGIPVTSLYGSDAGSLRPRPADLAGLDAIVCDLQDVGSRYYTFVYTMSYVMEAAGAASIPVVVLDRPNPLGGRRVEGPVLDPALSSFVGRFALPVRHGMTAGELAGMFREAFGIACDLRVVPMAGWHRSMDFEQTGLPWVPPSPNMPTPATARVYPGGCLVEGTNLSEGRGTTTPFELVGAPWLDPHALAHALRDAGLPGVAFRPARFRPTFQKHARMSCGGVQVLVADRERFLPFETYLTLLGEARRLGGASFDWRREPYEFETERLAIDLLLGRSELRSGLEAGEPLARLREAWRPELERFVALREPFLLYR